MLCCKYKTTAIAVIFYIPSHLSKLRFRVLRETKKPRPLGRGFVHDVIATGFEPVTVCLEGRCSIQLSYATIKAVQI